MSCRSTILVLLLAVCLPGQAHAYLDPTSGSILLQVLLGGLAGAALAVKLFWHKILGFFGFAKPDDDEPA
ncbi:MAG: hypothetical protein R3244_10800 [Thermoanaerobaculia bacterium]|nr:hypothetical protein [Thermoanaerobaculia bacterium]